ncbi:hypothetical protein, conserved [Leishmania tarentolae]|uniref:Uncharacterized protein n=1 Tax=Leishmania tarentolae TaxID=5689 RepID=A0A640KS69_LEITA|nr:hypothetical protein, conserved [Leishmania tarentolae]
MLDIPDYRKKPLIRVLYAWPAFFGAILLTLLTLLGMMRCVFRGLDGGSPRYTSPNTTTSVRQDIFYVVAAPLVFQGLCVSIYTTWVSLKFFRHN